MSQFDLALGFDWNSQSSLGSAALAQLQVCLSEALAGDTTRVASFYGELGVGDQLDVSIVDITGNSQLQLEVINAIVIFSRADRSASAAISPLESRYLVGAGASLEATRTLDDNAAYNVEGAPTWQLGQHLVDNDGTFAFSAAIIVRDLATEALRTFTVDPEMQVGSGT
jgi:hypothetical protein